MWPDPDLSRGYSDADVDLELAERDRLDRIGEYGSCYADPLKASREQALEENYNSRRGYVTPIARAAKLVPPANETRQLKATVDELRKRLLACYEAVEEHKAAKGHEAVGPLRGDDPDLVLWRTVRRQAEAA